MLVPSIQAFPAILPFKLPALAKVWHHEPAERAAMRRQDMIAGPVAAQAHTERRRDRLSRTGPQLAAEAGKARRQWGWLPR